MSKRHRNRGRGLAITRAFWIPAAAVVATVLASEAQQPPSVEAAQISPTIPVEAGQASVRAAGAQATNAGEGCTADPAGDTRQEDSGALVDFPRADLIEVCLGGGDPFDLSVTVREATDPHTDPNWDGLDTFAAWGLDGDADGDEDYVAVFRIESNGQLEGMIVSKTGNTICGDLAAALVGGRYRIDDVPRSCVNDDPVTVAGAMFYDSDASAEDAPVHTDSSPDGSFDGGAFTPRPPGPVPRTPASTFDGDPATTERIDHDDPAAAAIAVSRTRFPASRSASTVVLSRDDEFADSLAATPLTGDAPLILTPTGALSDDARRELRRVLVPDGTVYLLGGDAALSPDVEETVVAEGFKPRRLFGAGRVETALRVADEIVGRTPGQRTAVLARAAGPPDDVTAGWADSVTIGAWAADGMVPVLVTPTDELARPVDAWLDANGIDTTIVVGGVSAITDAVAAQVPGPRRVFGVDRAGTAAAVAAELIDGDPPRVLVVNGYREDGWAFGLPAAGLAADFDAPLLVAGDDVPGSTAAIASFPCDNPPNVDALLLGSAEVLGAAVIEQLDRVDGGPCPRPAP